MNPFPDKGSSVLEATMRSGRIKKLKNRKVCRRLGSLVRRLGSLVRRLGALVIRLVMLVN